MQLADKIVAFFTDQKDNFTLSISYISSFLCTTLGVVELESRWIHEIVSDIVAVETLLLLLLLKSKTSNKTKPT